MSDLSPAAATQGALQRAGDLWRRADKALLAIALALLALLLLDPAQLGPVLRDALSSLLATLPFLAVATLALGYVKASGAEALLSRAFQGNQTRMIVVAALVGGIAPFCSCQVIPFIAAALAMGAPLAAVMAFWLSSPLMDPGMFTITAAELGTGFAVAKTVAAVGIGAMGGFVIAALSRTSLVADPLRPRPAPSSCSTAKFRRAPNWRFWQEAERRATFRDTVGEQALFLGKWLLLAYVLEALMIRHVPAEWIGQALGGSGAAPIVTGALIGAPAYLNGYAAVPLMAGLIEQGMVPGAAMAFVIAGGITCIPAAVAVWALVKPRIFAAYIGFAFVGALIAGFVWQALG